ncbi:MAG: dihydrolipoamide acetyltransferase family protein [Candidatus Limivicinus sp.]
MSVEIVMPRAGLTMTEGTISEWKAAEGAAVSKGDVLMEFENEKNIIPCEALDSGLLHILVPADGTAAVGQVIGLLAADRAEYEALTGGGQPAAPAEQAPAAEPTTAAPAAAAPEKQQSKRVRATGYAKKLAAAAGLDLALVQPSGGPDGLRITAKDVQAHLAKPKTVPAPAPVAAAADDDEIIETPWTGVRKTIARNMFNSLQNSAQTTSVCEVDATELLALRAKLVDAQDILGTKITVNDMLCMLMAKVAAKHPFINATFDGTTLYSHKHVHLSFAVGAEHGLMVPVIRNIDTMSITEISRKAKDLAVRAKNKQLSPEEQSGGTFTISNVGMFPIDFATPVINPPQTAIVGIGRTVRKPVVMPDDSIAIRDMMHVFLTFDHRVIDGLEAGRFFADMERYFKHPELILA